MARSLLVNTPVTYVVADLEPRQARMGVTWAESDPAVIKLCFYEEDEEPTIWTLARDLFADCLLSEPGPKFGNGDAVVERGLVSMFLTLSGENALGERYRAGITFLTTPILELITQSLMVVPRGEVESESIQAELDEWLLEALSE